mgnify:CR=1 FL=1
MTAENPAITKEVAARIHQFHAENGLWVGKYFLTLDDAYDRVFTTEEYVNWWRTKVASEGEAQKTIGVQFRPMMSRLLEQVIQDIATEAVTGKLNAVTVAMYEEAKKEEVQS